MSELTVDQQLKVLERIWGSNEDGYVFLPWIEGTATTPEDRRAAYHEGRAFEWPRERDKGIRAHLEQHQGDELYFTPNRFLEPQRRSQFTAEERVLYADLDPVDPRRLDQWVKPTVAWETSPDRFQAVWIMTNVKVGASSAGGENHRLTMYLGADPSGWDSTQILRVPGRPNRKGEYGGHAPGRLLWDNGPRYTWGDWDDLPQIVLAQGEEVIDLLDEELINDVERARVWAKIELKVSQRVRQFMKMKAAPSGIDRSETLWEIERELADQGCSLVEIIAIIRPTVWNKYAGRADELKRLKIEVSKAIAERGDDAGVLGEATWDMPGDQWLFDVARKGVPRPRWLIKDVWTEAGCGFISGAPKSYKSWLALDLALSVATGTPFLGHSVVGGPQPVLYLQEEDNLPLVFDRMEKVMEPRMPQRHWDGWLEPLDSSVSAWWDGAGTYDRTGGESGSEAPSGDAQGVCGVTWNPPGHGIPLQVHVRAGFTSSDPVWQVWLDEMLERNEFKVVVIDTMGTTAGDVDLDRASELTNKVLKPLRTLSEKHGVAVVVVHHNKKDTAGGGRQGSHMLGSVALHAWVDCALYASAKEDGENSITLHSEVKAAMGWTKTVVIPRMGPVGEAVPGWEPEVVDTRTDAPKVNEGAGESKARKPVGIAPFKLRSMGPNPTVEKAETIFSGPDLAAFRRGMREGTIREVNGLLEWEES